MAEKSDVQIWELILDGRAHRVESRGSMNHHVRWYVDGDQVAEKKAMEEKLRLEADERPELEALAVRFSGLGHGIRATVGEVDLVPEPGSKAAAYEEKIRAYPRRYAVIQTTIGVAKVVVPIIVTILLARLALRIPMPDWNLPDISGPNLPDLPGIPWPDISLPTVTLPEWVRWLLDKTKYVVPVLVAIAVAQGEIKRRRKQDKLRDDLRAQATDEE